MLTTLLILVPIGAALVVWVTPLPREWTAALAVVGAAAELGLWIGGTIHFDYGGGLQYSARRPWFSDLGVSYHVGFYGFSLWLTGLAVIVGVLAIAYGVWAGRDRPRAYYGLMLFLTGSIVGVFAAQDLLLFYAFFEAMLIPLYVLVGVWGGPRRVAATVVFVIYTMAGSMLMLASVVAFGISRGTFDLVDSGSSANNWIFLGFAIAFAVKSPLLPFHGWLRAAYTEAPPEVAAVLSGVVSKAAVYGFIRIALPKFPGPVDHFRNTILALAAIGLAYGSILAFRQPDIRSVVAYSSLGQMSLITLGIFSSSATGLDGAVLHSVNHGLVSAVMFLLAGFIEQEWGSGEFARLGAAARGRPILATVLMAAGMFTLAVPGSANFAGEFLILTGVFRQGWGFAAVGAAAMVLAAMYTLRLISAVLHERRGEAVPEAGPDLRFEQLVIVVPLVACLLALSVWPNAVSGHSFPGSGPNAAEIAP
jgi:NADH-quinone oxidoreductase subunit M